MTDCPQLIYLAFGPEIYQQEAIFSIVTAIAHGSVDQDQNKFDIQVFTDTPALYTSLPVAVTSIDPSWADPYGYHFKIKHVVLRKVLGKHNKAALIDTDTFFRQPPSLLFQRIRPGHLLCNAIGRNLNQDTAQVRDSRLLIALRKDGMVDGELRRTNSGVIGLTSSDIGLLDLSIALMDKYFETAEGLYTLEEFCLAIAGHKQRLSLAECTDLIHHFWSRKAQFRAKIHAWHMKHSHTPLSKEALADALSVNDKLPRPGQPMRAIQKLITLGLPSEMRQFGRELLYGCYDYPNEFDCACTTVWWEKARDNAEARLGRPLGTPELHCWLNHRLLRLLAGKHHPAICKHLLEALD